jgi:hypothetical protein
MKRAIEGETERSPETRDQYEARMFAQEIKEGEKKDERDARDEDVELGDPEGEGDEGAEEGEDEGAE